MAAFKKGDWVRMTETDYNGGYKSGDVFRLTGIAASGVRFDDNDGDPRYADHDSGRFEPWTPKIGERVRYVASYGTQAAGKEAVVLKVSDYSGIQVRQVVNGAVHTELPSSLEPVTDSPLPVAAEAQPAAPVAEPLTVRAGCYYKTRDGRKVGPMVLSEYPWEPDVHYAADSSRSITGQSWCIDGTFIIGATSPLDIIAEWPADTAASDTTTSVDATVDALDEKYGPGVAVADVPVAEPKFNVGDVVKFRDGYAYDSYAGQKATVIATNVWRSDGVQIDMDGQVSTEKAADLVHADESESSKPPMIRTRNGYGFELARAGAYVWVDIGQKAPITVRADSIKAA